MLAAVLVGPRQIEIKDVANYRLGSRSLLIAVKATAICGSDLHFYQTPEKYLTLPRIPGHEISGVIADKGKEVTKFAIGERVVPVAEVGHCGKCQPCHEGKEYLCLVGGGLRGRDVEGGFAEYVLADESEAFKLPDSIPDAESTQIQTLTTVYHGFKRLQIEAGKSALIVGLGATGLLHVQLAKLAGATPVVVTSRSQWKLDLAKKLGADIAIQASDKDALAQIKNATKGQGPDAVIEAVGSSSTVALSIEAAACGGKVLLFGNSHDPFTGFDPYQIYFKEINLIGSRSSDKVDWQPVINLVESGRVTLKPIVTHRLPFKDVKKGFAMMDAGAPGLLRAVVSGAGS